MMIPYLPTRIVEKYDLRFLRRTTRIGEHVDFEGFLLTPPKHREWREALWEKLSPLAGNFKVKGITPFPHSGAPMIPVVVPEWIRKGARIARVEGRVYDFSMFSNLAGRFVLAERIERIPLERYLSMEKVCLTGGAIREIFDSAFSELSRDVFMAYFLSSSKYLGRAGGNGVSVMKVNSPHYAQGMGELGRSVEIMDDMLRRDRFSIMIRYDEEMDVSINARFTIRYDSLKAGEALRYLVRRKTRLWERNTLTEGTMNYLDLLNLSEVPYIPAKEETRLGDAGLLREYALDIGIYAFQNHLRMPELPEEYVESFKMRVLRILERDIPRVVEAMRMGIIMDLSDVNGFGEHVARVINSWERLGSTSPEEEASKFYVSVFERIDDVFGERIEREMASLSERRRVERMINRVLWELNYLKPEGWDYEYFESKILERGYSGNVEALFRKLVEDGIVIEKRKGRYRGVASL